MSIEPQSVQKQKQTHYARYDSFDL